MRVESAESPLLEPLRGEQQMDAEGSAQSADRDEEIDEVRLCGQQLGELVDHHEQGGQRLQRRAGPPRLLVVVRRGEARVAEQLLTAYQLSGEGVLQPLDQREVLVQIG